MEAILLRIFVEIDLLIHQGIAEVFKLIFRIAEVDIFTEEAIGTFSNRIYGILGVLILFKIVISCIQYLVSPDKMADKDKGMGALITRTIISFVLLALVPTIFSFAKKVETNIAGVIPTIILGQNVDYRTQDGQTAVEKVGSWMSFVTLKAFVNPKEDKQSEITSANLKMENFDDFYNNVTHGCGWLFADENCVYDYNFIFSIAVGVFMLYVLLSMGIDIAIRTIKLGLLQILAPIPIASYVNGQENFKTWYQTAFKVYADLFIRLIVIYFIVYIMATIGSGGMSVGFLTDPFVVIYIIVGLLMFAKQAPKFICDILGIKSDGFGGIADMFKRNPIGTAKRLYNDTKAAYGNKMEKTAGSNMDMAERRRAALKSALAAGKSSAWAGIKGAYNNKSHSEIVGGMKAAAQRNYDIRETMADKGVRHRDYYEQLYRNRVGYRQQAEQMNLEIEAASKASDKSKAVLDYAHNNMSQKFSAVQFTDSVVNDVITKTPSMSSFSVGSGSNQISFNFADIKKGGSRTISGVMEDLKVVIANQNGVYSGEEVSRASGYLDKLQGISDSYVVSQTERLANAISKGDTAVQTEIKDLGFDANVNPAFYNMIQDAKDAIGTYQNNTSYGRDTKAKGINKQILDNNGEVKDGMLGEWLKFNKSEGQTAQQQSKEKADLSALAAKEIADKYDKKS